ncbi:BCCT family transporter [Hellea balneolensis]|uniref:BCCT family transporter n=1 Tax=Hellea balneolensis TaxID=287478 RepID=UPI00040B59D5|nr:BCCT family transporter [Hellea balneolensis]
MPLSVFTILVFTSLIWPEGFLRYATYLNDTILALFSNVFAWAAFAFLMTILWAAFSPLGKIKIGGEDATPLLSRWNWMAVTLTTTIAIGILFWGTAEPIYHLYDPGGTDLTTGSDDAARFSLVSLFMHWSFTPYAIYTLPGLTFALVYYNLKLPFSLSSPLTVLTGRPIPKAGADLLDGIALLALLFGLSASLGAGIMSISGGIARLTPLDTGPVMLAIVAIFIVAAFFISSASGLHKGIRILSDINTKVFLGLILFVFIAGPTLAIIDLGGRSALQYLKAIIPRSLLLEPFNSADWLNSWTVFYFANWMAWAPLAALFLGRISRGYRVREYILVNLVIPAFFSMLWMTIFGGMALNIEMQETGVLNNILQDKGPEHVLYAVLDYLPLAAVLAAIVTLISFLSYVTAADSNMDVISNLCLKSPAEDAPKRAVISLKLVFAIAVGFAAWIMTSLSGIDGIKMLSNLGGFPALFIIIAFNVVLLILGTTKIGLLRAGQTPVSGDVPTQRVGHQN